MEEPEIEREKKLNLFFVDGDGDTGLAALVGGLELAANVAATGGDGGGRGGRTVYACSRTSHFSVFCAWPSTIGP